MKKNTNKKSKPIKKKMVANKIKTSKKNPPFKNTKQVIKKTKQQKKISVSKTKFNTKSITKVKTTKRPVTKTLKSLTKTKKVIIKPKPFKKATPKKIVLKKAITKKPTTLKKEKLITKLRNKVSKMSSSKKTKATQKPTKKVLKSVKNTIKKSTVSKPKKEVKKQVNTPKSKVENTINSIKQPVVENIKKNVLNEEKNKNVETTTTKAIEKKQLPKIDTGRKRIVTNINNITPEIWDAIKKKYPYGYEHYVFKVQKNANESFYAITVDTEDTSYLIKVDVKVDLDIEEIERDDLPLVDEDINVEGVEFAETDLDEEPEDDINKDDDDIII